MTTLRLRSELSADDAHVVPLTVEHIEPLRRACAEDTEIWEIYPYSMLGQHFDAVVKERLAASDWVTFAALQGEEVIGTTSYIRPDLKNGVLEIGGTYIAPRFRGSGYNTAMKQFMIEHAFACGYERIVFLVDERNLRSQAAVLKLGATREGLLRRDRVTWTGHLRNTCVFGLLRDEWRP
ncbi:MAG: GNAT family protein [Novosphingobium sp.]